jgi:hypothetical protein
MPVLKLIQIQCALHGWAIDDVRLFGTKLMNTTFSWGAGSVDAYIDSTV